MSAIGKSPNPTSAKTRSRNAGTSAMVQRALEDMIAVGGSASLLSLRTTPSALPRSTADGSSKTSRVVTLISSARRRRLK